jgi:HAD superfamily hydrolase (TIGR01509 family)
VDHAALLTPPGAVIFDLNGTISDDEPLLAELFEQIFGEVGIEVTRDLYFEEFAGYSDAEICERVLAHFGRSGEDGLTEWLVERRTELYLERQRERPTVTPSAMDFVRRVAERVPVAVASGAARREVEAGLTAAGIRGLFDVLVCMEDVSAGKPDPAGYLLALDRLQHDLGEPIDAADVLVFEDSEQGLRAALAAGMRCVVVAGTAPVERLGGAAAIVDRLDWSIPMVEGWR